MWLTGRPGSGRTTVGLGIVDELCRRGHAAVLLDEPEVRAHLGDGTASLVWLCRLLVGSGVTTVVAVDAPGRDERERIRAEIPGFALRSTVICGFPGETDAEHDELVRAIDDLAVERLGAFPYSHEKDTPAGERFPDDVPADVKAHRVDAIMKAPLVRCDVAQWRLAGISLAGRKRSGKMAA